MRSAWKGDEGAVQRVWQTFSECSTLTPTVVSSKHQEIIFVSLFQRACRRLRGHLSAKMLQLCSTLSSF